jgi:hypothetical protein
MSRCRRHANRRNNTPSARARDAEYTVPQRVAGYPARLSHRPRRRRRRARGGTHAPGVRGPHAVRTSRFDTAIRPALVDIAGDTALPLSGMTSSTPRRIRLDEGVPVELVDDTDTAEFRPLAWHDREALLPDAQSRWRSQGPLARHGRVHSHAMAESTRTSWQGPLARHGDVADKNLALRPEIDTPPPIFCCLFMILRLWRKRRGKCR